MLDVEIIVRSFAETLVEKIKGSIKSVTGKTASSIYWTWDGKNLRVVSSLYWITVLEDGRKPGKRPPKEAIKNWLQAAGIASDIPIDSLAFLIARSIGEKGTLLYQQGGKSGILSRYINEAYIKENLTDVLAENFINEIKVVLFK